MESHIMTRFLVLSDTHGEELQYLRTLDRVDVAIHCGDLTEESKLAEFRASLRLLKDINAPVKLVIPGNHDFTMDIPMFKTKLADIQPPLDDDLVKTEYGDFGEAAGLFTSEDAKAAGIVFLEEEGTHRFALANGAQLTVYASPYTPSLSDWGFQYHPQQDHNWAIESDTDMVVTHGPPRGLFDYTDSRQRAGSSSLFAAIAQVRPRMHCFGHIHEGWGAKLVTWRGVTVASEPPTHFEAIDNDRSMLIENLSGIRAGKFDSPEAAAEKASKLKDYKRKHCCLARGPVQQGVQTLFVNAAIEGKDESSQQLPWIIDIGLPRSKPEVTSKKRKVEASEPDGGVGKLQRRTCTPPGFC